MVGEALPSTILPGWARALEQGRGRVELAPGRVRLLRSAAAEREYSNAQVDDRAAPGGWRPPLRLTVRARFSHPVARLRGTAGFGFWNAALAPGVRLPRPPRAAWFFLGAPPYDVPLALDVPGSGFKAATLDARRLAAYALLPAAPVGFLLMRSPALYRRLWPVAQRAPRAAEASLSDLDVTAPHTYALDWQPGAVRFAVDGRSVLETPASPGSPLRFIAWIDNSCAVATPQGRFGFGLVAEPEPQWLEIERLEIERQG